MSLKYPVFVKRWLQRLVSLLCTVPVWKRLRKRLGATLYLLYVFLSCVTRFWNWLQPSSMYKTSIALCTYWWWTSRSKIQQLCIDFIPI